MGNTSSNKNDPDKCLKSKIFIKSAKPCLECQSVKSKVDLARNERLFCLPCFDKNCLQELDCVLLKSVINKITQTNFKFRTLLKERTEEIFIQYKGTTREEINETTVKLTIILSKRFEPSSMPSEQTDLLENCMQIEVTEKAENHVLIKDAMIVRIENNYRYYYPGIFETENTHMEKTFVKGFVDKLKSESIKVIEVKDCLKYLQHYDAPLFVVCLRHSRLHDDVKYGLQNIEEQFFGRIILVLLHFKIDDTSCEAQIVKDNYSALRVIDYFQQERVNNIDEVMQRAKKIIMSDY